MTLLEKIREVESTLKKEKITATDLVNIVSETIGCNSYLVNATGDILSMSLLNGADCAQKAAKGVPLTLKTDFKQRIAFTFQTAANISVDSCFLNIENCSCHDVFLSVVPIHNARENSGHLLLTKAGKAFTDEELIIAETASLITSIFFYENNLVEYGTDSNHNANIPLVLDSLSFSELKAINNVFNDLNGLEGFLVASKIADRIGISRSVIVNAMRKLESAGIVDSRSLGIKGTYIKVKNPLFLEVLKSRV
jgi:transcriptional pleiotropic repressor